MAIFDYVTMIFDKNRLYDKKRRATSTLAIEEN